MSRHATALAISRYLDDELDPSAIDRFESHLEECPDCRHLLGSMRRLTTELAGLAPQVPPPALASDLERRLRGLDRSVPWLQSFEGTLKRWSLQSALVPLFATLLAIAMMVVLLAHGLSGGSAESSSEAYPVASSSEANSTVLRRVVGDRVFEERAAVWFESGAEGPPERVLDLRGRAIPPELADYAVVGAAVQLHLRGERVRVLYR